MVAVMMAQSFQQGGSKKRCQGKESKSVKFYVTSSSFFPGTHQPYLSPSYLTYYTGSFEETDNQENMVPIILVLKSVTGSSHCKAKKAGAG